LYKPHAKTETKLAKIGPYTMEIIYPWNKHFQKVLRFQWRLSPLSRTETGISGFRMT